MEIYQEKVKEFNNYTNNVAANEENYEILIDDFNTILEGSGLTLKDIAQKFVILDGKKNQMKLVTKLEPSLVMKQQI